MTYNEDVKSVLEYWQAVELLKQDNFEMATGEKRILKNFSKHCRERQKRGRRASKASQTIQAYLFPSAERSLEDLLTCALEEADMEKWGNLIVYIGKVKREDCVDELLHYLPEERLMRPEKSKSYIPALSFQLNPKGEFVKDSVSVSHLLWALKRLSEKQSKNQNTFDLTDENYRKDIVALNHEIEKLLELPLDNTSWLDKDRNISSDSEAENFDQGQEDNSFSVNALEFDDFLDIYDLFSEKYLAFLNLAKEDSAKAYFGVKTRFYSGKKAKKYEENDEEVFSNLSMDFYSDDLSMVKNYFETASNPARYPMLEALSDYILAPDEVDWIPNRLDILHSYSGEQAFDFYQKTLDLSCYPDGKWPAAYSPALMQQVAINQVTSPKLKENHSVIFSVNGPPGTGKTTLLKEIIAHHIVEKAKLLSEYPKADDAFEAKSFKFGDKRNHAYSKYIPRWYKLKNDTINDYSILVVSSNNNAVENITKELPIRSKIRGSLSAKQEDHSEAYINGLKEVETLFCGADEKQTEVYFSEYASKLFGDKKEEINQDIWGLVAAPLGKTRNIGNFYFDVLNPLLRNELLRNDTIEARQENYSVARDEFLAQLKKVRDLSQQMKRDADIVTSKEIWSKELPRKINELEHAKEKAQHAVEQLEQILKENDEKTLNLNSKIQELVHKDSIIQEQCQDLRHQVEACSSTINNNEETIVEEQKKLNWFNKLILRSKYQRAEMRIADLKEEIQRTTKEIESLEQERLEREKVKRDLDAEKQYNEKCRGEIFEENRQNNLKLNSLKTKLHRTSEDIVLHQLELAEKERRYKALIDDSKDDASSLGDIFDEDFFERLMSEDETVSGKAHVTCPWTTSSFDREREKLLYSALQLTREFVLSSKSCRTNLNILAQYWEYQRGDDKEIIQFDERDKRAFVPAILQTLFLFVPVVSSTFASVGRLLGDVVKPEVFGTLVVDEAGQAQPQTAVGSLFRFRNAVVVGDPQQIEPIVTDDEQLMKTLLSGTNLKAYKDKTLSVQKNADWHNPYGTYIDNGTDYPDWLGCPLLVHRRCISPMYDISNKISYGGIMKNMTNPPSADVEESLIFPKSQWLHITGNENGNADHYNAKQGSAVIQILEKAVAEEAWPDLFIISPFKTVVSGLKRAIKKYCTSNSNSPLAHFEKLDEWLSKNIGTVHTFQGKEAKEVIFLLGCDRSDNAKGAIQWVNNNIVNVAVTRAKYRLCVIGDRKAWRNNIYLAEAMRYLDILPFQLIQEEIENNNFDKVADLIHLLPDATSFAEGVQADEGEDSEYSIETDEFTKNLDATLFKDKKLTDQELNRFGFRSYEELNQLDKGLRQNLEMAIKLYFWLEPLYQSVPGLDASCCAIIFCKALELQLNERLCTGLQKALPDFKVRWKGRHTTLADTGEDNLMLGTVRFILQQNKETLAKSCMNHGKNQFDQKWWNKFYEEVNVCVEKRNQCCHAELFNWSDMETLLNNQFGDLSSEPNTQNRGAFYKSEVGKLLENFTG